MRFGKKLALQVQEDSSGAPYLSHKPMKEAINRTVREVRNYQAKVQDLEQARLGNSSVLGLCANSVASSAQAAADLSELEERVSSLDRQLFALVDEDLARLLHHVRAGEATIMQAVAGVQGEAMDSGLLMEESKLRAVQKKLPGAADQLSSLCRHLLDLQVSCDPGGMSRRLWDLTVKYNSLVELMNGHSQYLEINVAGFRKLLKRHEKQIPAKFRARPMPFLGFHRLVTHTSHQLLEICKQIGQVIVDARQRLAQAPGSVAAAAGSCGPGPALHQQPELKELKGLGPECDMVLKVQKQLKDPMNSQLAHLATLGVACSQAPPGFLYPKPEAQQLQHQQQQQLQQQHAPQQPQPQPQPQLQQSQAQSQQHQQQHRHQQQHDFTAQGGYFDFAQAHIHGGTIPGAQLSPVDAEQAASWGKLPCNQQAVAWWTAAVVAGMGYQ